MKTYASLPLDAFIILGLRRISWPRSYGRPVSAGDRKAWGERTSTRPVYSRIPAEKASRMPETALAVAPLPL